MAYALGGPSYRAKAAGAGGLAAFVAVYADGGDHKATAPSLARQCAPRCWRRTGFMVGIVI